ncbi:YceI family protein [Anaeromyxobacter terrae]|uniref:YceI family protein n=1 Tax=Anaeromyxobacter terrae TaxID=2925406 RepID=UPI001F581202|nr:YceI family protein [Anaeromyxobacter sp. SG22]
MAETAASSARTFGPGAARCEVLTFREGALSALAHDLLLDVTAFDLVVDPAVPSVTARFDPASLRVVGAMRDGRPLAGALRGSDAREIEETIAATVLRARRFPEIRFTSTGVSRREGGYEVRGTLTLAGVTRPIEVPVRRDGERLVAEVPLHQPSFGVKPYTAMLGTLRVKADVLVRLSLPAEGL